VIKSTAASEGQWATESMLEVHKCKKLSRQSLIVIVKRQGYYQVSINRAAVSG